MNTAEDFARFLGTMPLNKKRGTAFQNIGVLLADLDFDFLTQEHGVSSHEAIPSCIYSSQEGKMR
jgi:hypothetical protein